MECSVSIIMPIYNRERFLKKSIESVLAQTYKKFELILINDGSTDATEEVCLKYQNKDSRIKYLKIKNSGPSVARNEGMKIVESKYIMFIDSDDWYEEDMLQKMLEHVENGFQCIVCNRIICNNKFKTKINMDEIEMNNYNIPEFMEYLQKKNLFNGVCNKVYMYDIIKNNNIQFDKTLISGEDYKFNLDYFSKIERAKTINEFLYNYFTNPNSIVHDLKNSDFFLQVNVVDYNKKIYEEKKYNFINLYYKYVIILIDAISAKIQAGEDKKLIKEYIKQIMEYDSIKELKKKKFEKTMEDRIIKYFIKQNLINEIYLYVLCRTKVKMIRQKVKNIIIYGEKNNGK